MERVDGSRLILMVEADGEMSAIAYSTEHELTLEAETMKKAPEDDGGWDCHAKKGFSWKITINHLLSMVKGKVSVESLVESKEVVKILIAIVAPGGFDYADVEPQEALVSGNAMFQRMTITGQQGGLAVMSVQLLGNDELVEEE